jgi:large subunit ribosomal protein L30
MAKKAAKKTQIKSVIGTPEDQKRTVRALGLKRIRHSVEQADTPAVRGMVFKVKHLVDVEEI